jgi:hypothetical protein
MLPLLFMLLLLVIGGWLDARLNWQQAESPK